MKVVFCYNQQKPLPMKFRLLILVLLVGTASASVAHAQFFLIPEDGLIAGKENCNFITGNFDFECFPLYLASLINLVFLFTGGFCLTEILFAGYNIAMSGLTGDKEKGKNRITWALIGLAASICSFVIVNYILSGLTFGAS